MTTSKTSSTLVIKHLCCLVVTVCAAASNLAEGSTVLINTINGTTAKAINATPSTAQRFTTTTNAYEVNAVALYMQYSGVSGVDGQYSVIIYDATGTNGAPGTLIQSIATGNLSSLLTAADTPTLFAVNTSVSLNANQDYWLVLQRQNGSTGTLQWSAWGSPTGGTNTASFLSSFNGAGPWSTPVPNSINSGEYYRMEVTAVPEPGTYALLASGLCAAAVAASRRRSRSSAQRQPAPGTASLSGDMAAALSSHTSI